MSDLSITSLPSRSATVLATFSILSYALAESPIFSNIPFKNAFALSVVGHTLCKISEVMPAFEKTPVPLNRSV